MIALKYCLFLKYIHVSNLVLFYFSLRLDPRVERWRLTRLDLSAWICSLTFAHCCPEGWISPALRAAMGHSSCPLFPWGLRKILTASIAALVDRPQPDVRPIPTDSSKKIHMQLNICNFVPRRE